MSTGYVFGARGFEIIGWYLFRTSEIRRGVSDISSRRFIRWITVEPFVDFCSYRYSPAAESGLRDDSIEPGLELRILYRSWFVRKFSDIFRFQLIFSHVELITSIRAAPILPGIRNWGLLR